MPAEVFETKIAEAKEASKELGFTTIADGAARKVVHAAKVARPLPEGKYRVIYADPPCKYRDSGLDDYGHAERHYPSMSIEDFVQASHSRPGRRRASLSPPQWTSPSSSMSGLCKIDSS